MGSQPSRQQLPPEPPFALDLLPPELLVQVLSHVPPRALVTRCRAVCRAWRDVVDGPSVWLLQLARDRSAQGRALYAMAKRCPPGSEDEEEFPLCALARCCLREPLRRNLIFNSCGEQGFRGWEVEHGGNGWAVEKNVILVPGAPSQTCFITSFEWCFKRQLVDLVMEGVWQELLDSAQIEICVTDWLSLGLDACTTNPLLLAAVFFPFVVLVVLSLLLLSLLLDRTERNRERRGRQRGER
ncbi:F-box only protein 17 isoform X4 [Erinaceus europaeus]|uniref:F-box only protein 17 isoform X4 n=1 Tax=Erinaceus europaeus TaxID=9365 RepID=A0ABM3WZ91_ERIEU|nr:F-box only protein 17 isoform X4 [Erinaceus europaeus]